ncbi:MAG: hypothetical protein JNL18_09850 [Planctomycetaceae bacterium]|nr:hypothetical protein [Planctomycetaceae bacterium]
MPNSYASRRLGSLILLTLTWLLAGNWAVGANYDESVLSDLSGTPATPTTIQLDLGDNKVIGSAGAGDFDLIQFSIPSGRFLQALTLTSYVNPFNAASFVGLGAGITWPAGLDFDVDPAKLMGWNHIAATGSSGVGADLLVDMSVAPFTPGFQRPLAAGDYTLLVQDTDNIVSYHLTFSLGATAIAGDFNHDQIVDGADLQQWAGDFGVDGGSDADGDGRSDGHDFLVWQRQFGTGAAASPTPEPAFESMLRWIVLAAAAMRRRLHAATRVINA